MMSLSEYDNIEIDGTFYDKDDIENLFRLQKQLLVEENIICSLLECIAIWQRYSWDLQASWLFFPENDMEILMQIKSSNYFTNFEEYSKEL